MDKEQKIKEILFWTAILVLPGGSLILAYRIINKQLNKLRRSVW